MNLFSPQQGRWSVDSTIQSITEGKAFIINNKFATVLSISKVINYTLQKGNLLKKATIIKESKVI